MTSETKSVALQNAIPSPGAVGSHNDTASLPRVPLALEAMASLVAECPVVGLALGHYGADLSTGGFLPKGAGLQWCAKAAPPATVTFAIAFLLHIICDAPGDPDFTGHHVCGVELFIG